MTETWLSSVALVWAASGDQTAAQTVEQIDELVAERPPTDARAVFEAATARDYAHREADAEPLYRRSLALGLADPHRARAVIQLATALRILGRPTEAIAELQEGFADDPDHYLADAARATLALALSDTGDWQAATAVALDALSSHLPEYGLAVRASSAALLEQQPRTGRG
jgi:tetratricopeptide (TPR) repeat protein